MPFKTSHPLVSALVAASMVGAAAAPAKDHAPPPGSGRAEVFAKVVDCRAIADNAQRLACYDASVAALDQAEKANQVVVMDRAQVRATRRSLFGFSLPRIRLFGGADDQDEVEKIDTSVASYTSDGDGRLVFTTPEGASWRQIDDRPTFVKSGMKVTIQKAALGSYFARFQGANSVRVIRTR